MRENLTVVLPFHPHVPRKHNQTAELLSIINVQYKYELQSVKRLLKKRFKRKICDSVEAYQSNSINRDKLFSSESPPLH